MNGTRRFRMGVAATAVGIACSFTPIADRSAGATQAGGASPAPTKPPAVLATLTMDQLGSDQMLRVSWSPSATGPVTEFVTLTLFAISATGIPTQSGATVVHRFLGPDSYLIPVYPGQWAVLATPGNRAGSGPSSVSRVIAVGKSCIGADLCVTVRPRQDAEPVRLRAQGFLHSVNTSTGGDIAAAWFQDLEPQQFRLTGAAADRSARRFAAERTQLLSDLWAWATGPTNGGYAKTPWSDWNAWRSFVTATVKRAAAEGWSPDYWDVWNEPNGLCCPKFAPRDLASRTTDRWLKTYEVAWHAIKAADPDAKVIGPSTSTLYATAAHRPPSASELDLDTFLAHAEARGLVWDAVSWHENSHHPGIGDISYSVVNIERHIASARAVMARHPGTVVDDTIFVNEYAASETHLLAGWAVGYFRSFEDADVAANRSCWIAFECWGGGMGGLLTPAGDATAAWWAHRYYGDLAHDARMAVVSNASWHFDGLASWDDATGTARVLLGRHWWCNQPVNAWCPFDIGLVADSSVKVTLDWPGATTADVTVVRLPAGIGALPEPQAVAVTRAAADGALSLTIPRVADGDALYVVATP